jgi:redox-sensitive bicupin YhaK (pirin superfamily)
LDYQIKDWRGVYLYVLEGGPVQVHGHLIATFGAAKVVEETDIHVKAETDAELILVDVHLS